LSSAATAAIRSAVWTRRSVPFGKYWRSRPLVFSLLGHCHGLVFWQKNTGIASVPAICAYNAISLPWSQVKERTTSVERRRAATLDPARIRRRLWLEGDLVAEGLKLIGVPRFPSSWGRGGASWIVPTSSTAQFTGP